MQRDDGKFFCYHDPRTGPGGFHYAPGCVNLWIHMYPSCINRRRDKLRKIYKKYKIKVVRLTPKQLEYFTFVKLRGVQNL